MEQNNYTELLGYSKFTISGKNGSQTPQTPNPDFSPFPVEPLESHEERKTNAAPSIPHHTPIAPNPNLVLGFRSFRGENPTERGRSVCALTPDKRPILVVAAWHACV